MEKNLINKLKLYELRLEELIKSAKKDKNKREKEMSLISLKMKNLKGFEKDRAGLSLQADIEHITRYLSKFEFYEEAKNKLYELFPELKK